MDLNTVKHYLIVFCLLTAFAACTKTGPKSGGACYQATTREEYDALAKVKADSPDTPIEVEGKVYDCVENKPTSIGGCYQAKNKEEFDKLTADQMRGAAVVVDGKTYDCLKAAN